MAPAPDERTLAGAAPHRIVVGIDFSSTSEQALEHAVAVARHAGSAITMVHIGMVAEEPLVPPSMTIPAHRYRELLLERLAQDRAALGQLRERHEGQGVEIAHVVYDGVAATGVAAAARELGADLVVVGSHGRTGLRRAVLGSVAEHTVRHAASSVLVARGPAPRGGYRRIVIGADFSARSDRAVLAALGFAASDADIEAVHCWEPPLPVLDNGEIETLGRHLRALTDRPLAVAALAEPPVTGILDRAHHRDADLIVVGSHGRRGLERLLLGSVAEVTVRRAPCSVLVAR